MLNIWQVIMDFLVKLFASFRKVNVETPTKPIVETPTVEPNWTSHGYWIYYKDAMACTIQDLVNANITDIFVLVSRIPESDRYYKEALPQVVARFANSGINVHAWFITFQDRDGKWIDPENTATRQEVMNAITDASKTTGIHGIHLDCTRYPGTANGRTEPITSFVKEAREKIQSVLTMAVMPETTSNAELYGQDYKALAPYVNAMFPMAYKGNYGKDTAWIGATTKWINEQAPGKVVTGICTYKSDKEPTVLDEVEVNQDILTAMANGSQGFVLFRYGLSDYGVTVPSTPVVTPTPAPVETVPESTCPDNQLKKGCTGANVKALQIWLANYGFYTIGETGIGTFGDFTEKAVKAFQSKVGIVVDGLVGDQTRNAMSTYNPTVNNGVYVAPRFIRGIKQATNYYCAPFSIKEVLNELFDWNIDQGELAGHMGTGTGGTGHDGIIYGTETEAKEHGQTVTVWFQNFSATGWQQVAEWVANGNIGLFMHILYRLKWGHYIFLAYVDMNRKVVGFVDSLNSDNDIMEFDFTEMEAEISATPYGQPSVGCVQK